MNSNNPQHDDALSKLLNKDPANSSRIIIYILAVLILCAIIWASIAKIEVVVNGEGRIITSGKLKVIQNLEGGILKQIYVEEGDKVKAGELVAQLVDTQFKADYQRDIVKMAVLDADISRLSTEAYGKPALEFPKYLILQYPEIVNEARQIYESKRIALNNELQTLTELRDSINQELKILTPLAKQQIISQFDIIQLKKEFNKAELQILEKKEGYSKQAREQLINAQAEKVILSKTLASTQDRLARTKLYSPVNGIINKVNVTTIGEVINPGQRIMEIVATDKSLQIEAFIDPKDIAFIHPGQQAKVKISAYNSSQYGFLDATVTTVSPDTVPGESEGREKSFYLVLLSVKHPFLGDKPDLAPLKPGMAASVSIVTGKRSIMGYFIKPLISF